jgi:hypothetical protein
MSALCQIRFGVSVARGSDWGLSLNSILARQESVFVIKEAAHTRRGPGTYKPCQDRLCQTYFDRRTGGFVNN